MTRSKRLSILGAGFLLLVLALVGCRPLADSEVQSGPADVSGGNESRPSAIESEPASAPDDGKVSSAASTNGYQEGFTKEGHPFMGNPAAPVTIEEFSSYQCPYCSRFFQESYLQIQTEYVETGLLRYVFRDYPLPGQRQSQLAAEAANCAGVIEGGPAFWAMHDRLFAGQREWSGNSDADDVFKEYAADIGLLAATFGDCLDSGATSDKVEADAREGSARGVTGTPTFFINDRVLVGAQPYAAFAQAIDAALAGEAPAAHEPAAAPTPVAIAPVDDARALGAPDAPVTIVEFSDYECPFCARHFDETWSRLKAEFVDTGRVRYLFKDFPIASLHPAAHEAHEAARCAGEQDAYWEMHAQLFAGQGEWAGRSNNGARFQGYATDLGLDAAAFDACLRTGRYTAAVNADVAEGRSLGISGTPTFFIDGFPIIGAQPFEVFQMAIGLAEQGTLGDAFQPVE